LHAILQEGSINERIQNCLGRFFLLFTLNATDAIVAAEAAADNTSSPADIFVDFVVM